MGGKSRVDVETIALVTRVSRWRERIDPPGIVAGMHDSPRPTVVDQKRLVLRVSTRHHHLRRRRRAFSRAHVCHLYTLPFAANEKLFSSPDENNFAKLFA